ncbi:ATP-binding protein [Pleurocapsales cyanobacterium LEGE 06147]|nr:ATP-binding protein [Pleurocapsales cyanobacterium LEGE 06147]
METLIVPGTLDSLGAIGQYVTRATSAAGLDKKAAYKLRLAVDEIATNIITHGYQEAGLEGKLYLYAAIDESILTIFLEDTGIIYNPKQQILPQKEELQKVLDERSMGGLGIYLALGGVDEFHYERVGNRNRNIFVMHRIMV